MNTFPGPRSYSQRNSMSIADCCTSRGLRYNADGFLCGFPSDDGGMKRSRLKEGRKRWRGTIPRGVGKFVIPTHFQPISQASSYSPSIPVGNHRVPPSLRCSICGVNVANDNMPSTPTPNTHPVQWIHPPHPRPFMEYAYITEFGCTRTIGARCTSTFPSEYL